MCKFGDTEAEFVHQLESFGGGGGGGLEKGTTLYSANLFWKVRSRLL